ncbi:hypothetical protein [Hyphomonas beringensis]|uniref:hypothetical protein n=1 Tax=Hyphomonas beringensis TaxID=1280946 RepID=UPI0012DE6B1A|nr:hypothetical protein [Hyphomonas beringensis]
MLRFTPFLLTLLLLGACASQPAPVEQKAQDDDSLTENVEQAAGTAYSKTREGFADAALSPLEDLNLRRQEIPPILKGVESPYDLPTDLGCKDINRLLAQLDQVLGPDWDTPVPDERLRTEKLADSASQATLNAVASEARGLIPFRGIIRQATGAESHQKKYNLAYKIGAQRRAYLKGMGLAKGCPLPARPNFTVKREENAVTYKGDSPVSQAPSQAYDDYQQKQLDNLTPVHPSGTTSSTPKPSEVGTEALQTVPQQ